MPSAQPPPLRIHQRRALTALESAWREERLRCWVELPPGAGKTRVGVEAAWHLIGRGAVDRVVVFGPNTAIQGQWVAACEEAGLEVGRSSELATQVTALTYQALAVFDADAEDELEGDGSLVSRLHDNGLALIERMAAAGPLLLILDESHHLLEVWGRLLAEVLGRTPTARVLGLTATPPSAMTAEQSALIQDLFGEPSFEVSIPAVVREGDLAPFAELAWVTTPTPAERDWLAEQAERFRELTLQLTDPAFGSMPFLTWLDLRFLSVEPGWVQLTRRSPDLCRAALRLHHAGLLGLPAGARVEEAHRQPPTAQDWALLIEDWLQRHVLPSTDPRDADVLAAVKAALPSVGYQWTRRGLRRGRSTIDRVLAYSSAKAAATVDLVAAEHRALGDRLRQLILCDHERVSAMLPVALTGVIEVQTGSALDVLQRLVADPGTAALRPLLVTGKVVCGAPATITALRDDVGATDPGLAERLSIEDEAPGLVRLAGSWSSREWVPWVSRFFEQGGSRVLVGTRALLGEGWDARRITGLVDLTTATTSTAVVQTRGRSLRVDPHWPGKVAINWTVTCVEPTHPLGGNDWDRLVRKHQGYVGPDVDGELVDGVAHLDPVFSPFAPPAPDDVDAANARAWVRSEARDAIRDLWQVGAPYDDRVVRTVRLVTRRPQSLGGSLEPSEMTVSEDHLRLRAPGRGNARPAMVALGTTAAAVPLVSHPAAAAGVLAAGWLAAGADWTRLALARGGRTLAAAATPPSIHQFACSVAEAMAACGLGTVGPSGVRVDIDSLGEYRCWLEGATEEEAAVFASALGEATGDVTTPRYLVPRFVVDRPPTLRRSLAAASGRLRPDGVVWHAVPAVFGVNAKRVAPYGVAWRRWVGGGDPVYTGSPEGAGILAAQQGANPLSITSVLRDHWE